MEEFLTTLLQAIITVAVPIITGFAVRLLSAKADQASATTQNELAQKYIKEASDAVTTAVLFVSQTYTDELKKDKTFSAENQRKAFRLAAEKAESLLTAEAMRFLSLAYGDLCAYLAPRIEAEVRQQKWLG